MTATTAPPSWGQENFGTAQLRDKRRTRCLVDLADRLYRHPGGSQPQKFGDPKALQRCYKLMNQSPVTHPAVLEPHCRRTFQRLRDHDGVALLLHDGTELDFTSHPALHPELGQIGDGHGRGYICHNSLAVEPGGRHVFGLVHQILHVRADVLVGETVAQKRQRENRESLLWLRGVNGLEPTPEGKLWVDVCDSLGDTFEFYDHEDHLQRQCVVRAWQERRIVIGHDPDGPRALLLEYVRTLPEQDRRALHVAAQNGRPARDTTVAVAFAAVLLRVPRNVRGLYRKVPLPMWVVRVWEVDPPADVAEPVEWLLLTNLPVETVAAAWEKVDWYACRWVIEEYHKAQKTGCAIEAPQYTQAQRLQPMIALLSVVAVSLLNLRDMSRCAERAEQPAATVVPAESVAVLSGWRYGERRALTVREFFQALARLGGHLNRKHDRPPGWLVLWRGWTKLQLMVEGARAAARPLAKASKVNHNCGP
jgi:hypothetical protein